jgi:hypothetical protein
MADDFEWKPGIWERPGTIVLLVVVVAALASAFGYWLGSHTPVGAPQSQVVFQPGWIQVAPAAKP